MGKGYELKCNRCGFSREICDGIGFCYPMECETLLEKMKKGSFGKGFMEAAKRMPCAAVHQNRTIFLCDHCGAWRADASIDLCAPVGEREVRKGKFCTAFDYPDDIRYVMSYDIGCNYQIVRSKQHRCGKCHYKMRLIKEKEKLKCPQCGTHLIKCNEFDWD